MFKHLQTKFLALLAIMLMGGGSVWAEEESFTFSELPYTNQQEVDNVEGTNVKIVFNQGTNSNPPKYYTSGTAVRVYGGNYFEITSAYSITKIELTFGSSDGSNAITTDVETYSNGTWTGSANSVKFTVGGTSGNRRIAAIKVHYTTGIGEKDDAVIVVEDANVAYGSSYTIDSSMIEGGDITVTSSNTSVATVDGLVITPVAVGSTTITVATAENEDYKAGSENFTLKVTAPEGKSTAPATEDEVVFYESFDGSGGTAGWSGNAASGTIEYDNTGWISEKASGNGGSAKFGTSSAKGSATTPAIGAAGDFTMTFKSGAWSGDKTIGALLLSIEGDGTLSQTSFDLEDSQWSDYSVNITGATESTKITFSAAQKSKNRFFLEDVRITAGAPTLTLSASGYASYCCEYPLDFSNINRNTFKAWYVSNVDMDKGDVTFTEITGSIKGGEAFFLYGEPNAKCPLTYANSCETTLQGNLLEGTLAPTYVENDNLIQNYGLSGGSFVQMRNGIVKAHKAYLPVLKEEGVAGARLNISFESGEATGINNTLEITNNGEVYNLQGQKVSDSYKGIVIRNGKKFMVK